MYIHSVKLINYKSIGDYAESEIILEQGVTAIIGKNESGKSNVLDGLAQIDFIGNKTASYASEKLNRNASEGCEIKYEIIIKPSSEDIEKGITQDTQIILSKGNYTISGGLLECYNNTLKPNVEQLDALLESLGSNPFKLRDQELTNYKSLVAEFKNTTNLNVPKFSNALSYLHGKQNAVPSEVRDQFAESLTIVEDGIKNFILILPHFFYRRTDKHLKTTYKLDEVEKELKPTTANAAGLLFDLVSMLGVSADEFINAVKTGALPQQVSSRKKINRLINEKVNQPFKDFYKTETIYLELDFNANMVSFTVQSEDGAALMLEERSNGLRWYLETFIDAKSHNFPGRNVVYLLDEPGNSLHVNAQKELIKLFAHLASEGNQVVYTTHSPYMLKTDNGGITRIRAVVKDAEGYTRIYKTAYDARIAPDSQKDTLAPLISALGMNLNDTFGPANNKINIVIEGMSDYIYISLMTKVLNIEMENYSIIPSVGASNCVNICSILHGWGCKYQAVFDYDKAGVETGGEHMRKNLFYELGEQFCYLADVKQEDIDSKTYTSADKRCVIEDLVTQGEIDRFCSSTNTSPTLSKPLIAKIIAESVMSGSYTLGDECKNNFAQLFNRIFKLEAN